VDALSQIISSFGLSGAAGLNAYIPLLAVGLLARTDHLTLQEPYALLATTPVLAVVALLGLVDFVADKIPAVDHAAHAVGAIVHPVAGAIVFASQNNLLRDVHPGLALAAGFLMAGGLHATRAAVRPVATTTTAGVGNPIVSFVEDATSLLLTALAFFAPVVALGLLLLLTVAVFRAWRAVRRLTRSRRAA
jgi:hypothetical protein